jgi:protein-tyrosine phosphatase
MIIFAKRTRAKPLPLSMDKCLTASTSVSQSPYERRLSQMSHEEEKRYHVPVHVYTDKDRWWYVHGFVQGLLWKDMGGNAQVTEESKYIEEICRDMEAISLADYQKKDAIIPESFSVGLQHALKMSNLPPSPIITIISEEEDVPRKRKWIVAEDKDSIHYIHVGQGYLAARPRPSLKLLRSWKADVLVTLSHTRENAKRTTQLQTMVDHCQTLQWIRVEFNILSSKPSKMPSIRDQQSLHKVDAVLHHLQKGARVVVHCHMGFHRTGFFIYVLLRRHGLSQEASLKALKRTRKCTHDELTYRKGNRKSLSDKAEVIFQSLFHSR